MTKTEAQKKAMEKWIEKNKETYSMKQRERALNYYYDHKNEILEKKKEYYKNKKAKMLDINMVEENPENV